MSSGPTPVPGHDLDLGRDDLDIVDPDSYLNGFPHATFQRLRDHDPVSWWPEHDGGKGFWAYIGPLVVGTVVAEDGAVLVFTQYVAMARLTADRAIASGRLDPDRAGALLDVLNKPLKDSTPTVAHSAGNGRLAQVAAAAGSPNATRAAGSAYRPSRSRTSGCWRPATATPGCTSTSFRAAPCPH